MEAPDISKKEICYPYEYDKEGMTSFATEEEWFQAISSQHELLSINKIKDILKLNSNNTIITRIKPHVRHIVLKAKGIAGEGNIYYDSKEFLQFINKPENFRRRSLLINYNQYSEIISESTRKKIKEYLNLAKDDRKGTYKARQALMQELKEDFYPFYVANCPLPKPPGSKFSPKLWEQCPSVPCSCREEFFETKLCDLKDPKNTNDIPQRTSKAVNKYAFERAMIEFAPFGYSKAKNNATEKASSRLFITDKLYTNDCFLVGYKAWCDFYQQQTGEVFDAMVPPYKPLPKEIIVQRQVNLLNAAVNDSQQTQAKQREFFEADAFFQSLNNDLLTQRQQYTFISGEAGTGKTAYICYLVQKLQQQGQNILLCAATGAAAQNINLKLEDSATNLTCRTVHSAFKLRQSIPPFGSSNDYKPKELENILGSHVIIIDEISMLRMDTFTEVMQRIRQAEILCASLYKDAEDLEWLTHKQIILVGDFCQLPPVTTPADKVRLKDCHWPADWVDKGGYCFFAPIWKELNFKKVILEHNFRQANDKDFLKALRIIRGLNPNTEGALGSILKDLNTSTTLLAPYLRNGIPNTAGIHIVSTNKVADYINKDSLDKLPGPSKIYRISTGTKNKKPSKQQLDALNITNSIELKKGALIITTKNDPQHRYYNGSRGIVTELGEDYVKVAFTHKESEVVTIEPLPYVLTNDLWLFDDDKKTWRTQSRTALTIKQLPLQLAYAITIHKSQGMTFEDIVLEPYSWDYGQFYTALSRVTSLHGLCLRRGILKDYIKTSPEVIAFYNDEELAISPAPKKNYAPNWESLGKTLSYHTGNYLKIKEQLQSAPAEDKEKLQSKQEQQIEKIMQLLIDKYKSDIHSEAAPDVADPQQ